MAEIINIFNFLKEFNELSNPVITEIENQKWSLEISDIPQIDEIRSVFLGHQAGELDYLEIKRPSLKSCPNPQEHLLEWIRNDWKQLSIEKVEVIDKLPRASLVDTVNVTYHDECFTDDQTRVNTFENWLSERNRWRDIEILKAKGLDLYNKLYQLYSEMKMESESVELILGDGNIRWNSSERIIDHPVLLQKVFLHFNPSIPSFNINCEEIKPEIYTPMLRVLPSLNQRMLSDIIRDVEEGDYDIGQPIKTTELFKRIVVILDNGKGVFIEEPKPINERATIYSKPIFFLRKRTLGFSSFIDGVIEDAQTNTEVRLPKFFEIMSGIYTENPQEEITENSWNTSGIDEEILLTLPANNEQLRIIKYLDRYGAVLVQGPPGTGKTHTIANLIGHLLSQGSSVLVTSHTEKALTVLKDKVYRDPHDPDLNLQNLCISILSSTSQKKEMDLAINEISAKTSSMDKNASLRKIEALQEERKKMVKESKQLTVELIRARSMEYKDLIFDNHSITPIDAAKFLNCGYSIYDYIIGKSNNDEIDFPLTHDETTLLYLLNSQITKDEEIILKQSFPPSDQILSATNFTEIIENIVELHEKLDNNDLLHEANFFIDMPTVNQLLHTSSELISTISRFEPLEKAIINQTISDPSYPKLWHGVLEKIDKIQKKYDSYSLLKLNNDIMIETSLINKSALKTINNILGSEKDKPVGFLSTTEWKKIRDAIKIDGKIIESRNDYIKSYELLTYEIEKIDIIKLLEKLFSNLSIIEKPNFDNFEQSIRKHKNQIIKSLSWYSNECYPFFEKIEDKIRWKNEIKLRRISSISDIDSASILLHSTQILLQAKINENTLLELTNKLEEYKLLLNTYSMKNCYMQVLQAAVHNYDTKDYTEKLNLFIALSNKKDIAKKRNILISRIKEVAPSLAIQIENREDIHSQHTIPEHFYEAWKYFQLDNQIKRLESFDTVKIKSELENVNNDLLKNARELAYEKSWYAKVNNQTDIQNQALQGWRNTVKQIGKGTGKNAPMLKAKARELMPLCQMAIPVWIMPLNRDVETFSPSNNKFDVIIIDEASQANILSLAALYMAKKVIIVGDDEQVSPDNFGVKIDEVNALVAQHLERIPNNHLFNGLTSLYDMAKSSGFKPLMLTEHFRCLPDIIGFSNELSYNGKIKPLRDSSSTSIYPALVEYRVEGASRDNKKVNEVEANHIVSLIQAFLDIDEYKGQTIGVISMLGNEQSATIESKLQAVIEPLVYESRRIQCGTPPQFQGDERDIIILSLVDSPNEKGGPLRLLSEDGNNDKSRKRFNVAVSRARNQLWVVHSLNPDIDLKPDDLRLKLIKYMRNPNRDHDDLISMSESPFETEVMKFLLAEGFKVIPQFKVGAYRIDMVIQYDDKKVALECDGERFHTSDNLNDDLARQAILERLGWRFIRIRGSEYYRQPEKTMNNVLNSLTKYGIQKSIADTESTYQANDTLIKNVKIKASSYRNEVINPIIHNHTQEMNNFNSLNYSTDKLTTSSSKQSDLFMTSKDGTDIPKKSGNYTKADKKKPEDLLKSAGKISSQNNQQQKTENIKHAPTFDFRVKKSPSNELKEKETETSPTKTTEATQLEKPKFDFRNKK